jgi:hypothetical protein
MWVPICSNLQQDAAEREKTQDGLAERIGFELVVAFRRRIALYWPTKFGHEPPVCRGRSARSVVSQSEFSKFQARVKRDHAWRTIGAQTDAEQAGRWGDGVGEGPEPSLRRRFSWNAGQYHAW